MVGHATEPAASATEPAASAIEPAARATEGVGTRPLVRTRRALPFASFLASVGIASLLASAALFAWGAHKWHAVSVIAEAAFMGEREETRRAKHSGDDATVPTAPGRTAKPDGAPSVPSRSRTARVGEIEISDIGLDAARLKVALAVEHELAHRDGRTLLVMVTGAECLPCRNFDGLLSDPLMQQALRRVRVVRIDGRAFAEELAELRIQTNVFPIFALLDANLKLRDAIHGGEWDEDVAANVAPVLASFVRGAYRSRRNPEWSPTAGGVRL
ncbi:MAG: hypothetical protein EXR75_16425 [Myxococcales bacterium]|nr:hypothetical protein [Myxococcales bacterium]